VIYLDNGDLLQGQPSAYYYNFIDTTSKHLAARILEFMGCSAGSMGNHDIETGPAVYDRFVQSCNFPWLAANAIRENSGESYFKPFYIKEIHGIKIAVLGMITPAIPNWLPKSLWKDMYFNDIRSTAEKWIPYLKEREKADLIIGLLHIGAGSSNPQTGIEENGGLELPKFVPGFNIVLLGHDHRPLSRTADYGNGCRVVFLNPGANGNFLSEAAITINTQTGKIVEKDGCPAVDWQLIDINQYRPSEEFLAHFRKDSLAVANFVSEKIAVATESFSSRDAYFGPSTFVDLIHRVQLDLTGADISFAAPLTYDTEIFKGEIFVSDMFKLYKYENFLYTMRLSGQEIKDFLEFSYNEWIVTMDNENSHLLRIAENRNGTGYRFQNASYNFDSAAGISYTVDVSKPYGQRISIKEAMKNGKKFSFDAIYSVAVNSYRGNGGGGHLTEGSGILAKDLATRVTYSTPVDLRYYLMQWLKKRKTLKPEIITDWKFVPEKWAKIAGERDYKLLFNP
jgi:2',3'-cyclic-nucleotide 2'-phosphodiesterase/3'-nucleotidase